MADSTWTTARNFLYRIVPVRADMLVTGPTEHEMQVMGAHFAHLQKLAADGVVLMAGRTLVAGPDTFGIVVFKAASPDEAEAAMRSDPAIAQGVMQGELFPYRVAVWSDGFRWRVGTSRRPKTFATNRAGLRPADFAANPLPPSAQDCSVLSLLSHDFRLSGDCWKLASR